MIDNVLAQRRRRAELPIRHMPYAQRMARIALLGQHLSIREPC